MGRPPSPPASGCRAAPGSDRSKPRVQAASADGADPAPPWRRWAMPEETRALLESSSSPSALDARSTSRQKLLPGLLSLHLVGNDPGGVLLEWLVGCGQRRCNVC